REGGRGLAALLVRAHDGEPVAAERLEQRGARRRLERLAELVGGLALALRPRDACGEGARVARGELGVGQGEARLLLGRIAEHGPLEGAEGLALEPGAAAQLLDARIDVAALGIAAREALERRGRGR